MTGGLAPGDPPPPPLVGFAVAYSRFLRSVFVIGGEDPVTHVRLGKMWRGDVEPTAWNEVPLRLPIGKPLAATVSFFDRAVYVLDETIVSGQTVARFLRVDAASGGTDLLGTWPRGYAFDTLWLVVDANGDLLLVASSMADKKHVVVRIDLHANPPAPSLVYKHAQPLAFPVLVDRNGFAFFQRKPNGTILVQREAALHDFGGGWAAVGSVL